MLSRGELEAVLDAGPAVQGWEDQCWTLARVAEMVRRRFGAEYTLAGLDLLLHRIDWSVPGPRPDAGPACWAASSPAPASTSHPSANLAIKSA
jgi:hypothetical protein